MTQKLMRLIVIRSICGLLMSSFVVPFPLLMNFAHAAKADEEAAAAVAAQAAQAQRAQDELIAQQAKRDRVIGLKEGEGLADPYFAHGQKVSVYPSGKPDQVTVYSFDESNANFHAPTRRYNLITDVDLTIHATHVDLTLARLNGKATKNIYVQTINVPGVVRAIKDRRHVHLLLKNGDIRTIFLVHAKAFEANEYAGGAELISPIVGVIPREFLNEDGSIQENISIEFYDSRYWNRYTFSSEFGEQSIAHLRENARYGDLLITKKDPTNARTAQVLRVFSYSDIWSALKGHVQVLAARDKIVGMLEASRTTGTTMRDYLDKDAPVSSFSPDDKTQDLLTLALGSSPVDTALNDISLARVMRRTQKDWVNHPGEVPDFRSDMLATMEKITGVSQDFANDTLGRSSYAVEENDDESREEVPEAGLVDAPELALQAYIQQVSGVTPKEARPGIFKRIVQKTVLATKKIGEKVFNRPVLLTAASLAGVTLAVPEQTMFFANVLWNGFTHLLPAVLTNGTPVHLFKLDPIVGPVMPGYAKFILQAILLSGVVEVLPLLFMGASEKFLGRKLPTTAATGWKIFFTLASRLTSRVFISWRDVFAKLVGQGDLAQAKRLGVSPEGYQASKEAGISDPSRMADQEQADFLKARTIAIKIIFDELISRGLLSADSKIDQESLEKALGGEGEGSEARGKSQFKILTERVALAEEAILAYLRSPQSKEGLNTSSEYIRGLHNVQIVARNGLDPLTNDEIAGIKRINKGGFFKKLAARITGQNNMYYRGKDGEVSDNVVSSVIGPVYRWDQHMAWATMGYAADFNDVTKPLMFMMSDGTGLTAGTFGLFPLIDWITGGVAWLSGTPTEELTFSNGRAQALPDQYIHAERGELSSRSREIMAETSRDTVAESYSGYFKGVWGDSGSHLFKGLHVLGWKITGPQLKTLKALLIIQGFFTFLGFFLGNLQTPEGQELLQTAGEWWKMSYLSVYRVLLNTTYAYIFYRFMWPWHYSGLDAIKESSQQNMGQMAGLVADLGQLILAHRSGEGANEAELKAKIDQISALYSQNGTELDPEILSIPEIDVRGERVLQASLLKAPTRVAHNTVVENTMTIGVGCITTIIGMIGFAKTWGWAKSLEFYEVGGIFAALFVYGGFLQVMGKAGASRLLPKVTDGLVQAVEASTVARSAQNDDLLFAAILRVKGAYETLGGTLEIPGVDMKTFQRKGDLDLLSVAKATLVVIRDKPPEGITKKAKAKAAAITEQGLSVCEAAATPDAA